MIYGSNDQWKTSQLLIIHSKLLHDIHVFAAGVAKGISGCFLWLTSDGFGIALPLTNMDIRSHDLIRMTMVLIVETLGQCSRLIANK